MRRTVRTLSVAVLAGAAFGATGTAVAATGPAAEVSPGSARPGTTVVVSVTCEKAGGAGSGQAPSAIDATSSAFAGRTVRLARVEQGGGLLYRGTAQVVSGDRTANYAEGDGAAGDALGGTAGAGHDGTRTVDGTCPAASGAQARPWSAHLAVAPADGGTASVGDGGTVFQGGGGTAPDGDAGVITGGDDGLTSRGDDGMFGHGDEGTDPAPHGDEGTAARGDDGTASRGDDGTASRGDGDVPRGNGERPPCSGGQQSCGGGDDRQECGGARGGDGSCAVAGVQHGVEAGDGGTYNTSVPALVAGAMLIAAACCGAVYRLWGRRFGAGG
ncbi:hypothetical protein ACWGKQ_10035 [Streptomyces sp. NPDC054770]